MKLKARAVAALGYAVLALAGFACGGGGGDTTAATTDGTTTGESTTGETTTIGTTTRGTTTGKTTTGKTTTGDTTTNGSTTTLETTTSGEKEEFGELTETPHRTFRIDGQEVDRKVDLFVRNLLATDPDGYAEFALKIGTSCKMENDSEVLVAPEAGIGLDFRGGSFWCSAEPGGEKMEYTVQKARLRTEEPVFGVTFEGGEAIVKVTYGSVVVESPTGEERRLLPERQLPVLPDGSFAREPEPIRLSPIERARAVELQRRLPRIPVAPPSAGAAGTLGEIAREDKVSVAVDSTDAAAGDFGEAFAKALADAWHVQVEVVEAGAEEATAGLADGTYDIVLTPVELRALTTSTVPLFEDASGGTWSVNVREDPAFAASVKTFVSADVLSGAYAKRYARIMDRPVTYEPVQPIAIRR